MAGDEGQMNAQDAGAAAAQPMTTRTAWTRSVQTPLREFLRTETGGAAVLLAAAAAALVWVNADSHSYKTVWSTTLAIRIAGSGVTLGLREWVNAGLMTFFFFVVGLEARREFDLGELRERRRLALSLLAGLAGAAATVGVYLAFNAGRHSAHGWGAAMSTDTAFSLGLLALVGPRFPDRLRTFLLTIVVADDVVALLTIAFAYSGSLRAWPLVAAILFYAGAVAVRRLRVGVGLVYFVLGAGAWVGLLKAGVEPVVIGLAMGVLAFAFPAQRRTLESATEQFRAFREQPTAELARSAEAGVRAAVSANERLQQLWHPWTSYAIVPLFALANAGIQIDGGLLAQAFSSPITLGILVGYAVGKPLGVFTGTWAVARMGRARLRPLVGWAAVAGAGTIAGIGFTVSLLIATLAFHGRDLDDAKVGILGSAVVASALTWLLFRIVGRFPQRLRLRALLGTAELPADLYPDVDPERDHIRGPVEAPVTVVEYGDFECPYCGRAEPVMRELLRDFADVAYVWRHLPLTDVHPHTQLAAQASEAATEQGAFWEMHDLLLEHQDSLQESDLIGYAEQLGLDVGRFTRDLREGFGNERIDDDVDSADLSGVSGTPTFFVNGRRHYGAYDIATLSAAVRAAGARALVSGAARSS
jgi:Na+/H+ antiporter NhaA